METFGKIFIGAGQARRYLELRLANRQSIGEAFAKSVARSIGSWIGREILRGVLGSLGRR